VRVLRDYLKCGILAHGFCPSCGARRMVDLAAHLVDHVFPEVPVRQWMLSLPHRIRYLRAYDPGNCALRKTRSRAADAFGNVARAVPWRAGAACARHPLPL
jgi:hypothetical protein